MENWIQVWGGIVGAGERAPESREEGKKEKRTRYRHGKSARSRRGRKVIVSLLKEDEEG